MNIVIPALRRLRQNDHSETLSLNYISNGQERYLNSERVCTIILAEDLSLVPISNS